jgi:hypothetical protein
MARDNMPVIILIGDTTRPDDAAGQAPNHYLAGFFLGADPGDDGFRDPLPRRFVLC